MILPAMILSASFQRAELPRIFSVAYADVQIVSCFEAAKQKPKISRRYGQSFGGHFRENMGWQSSVYLVQLAQLNLIGSLTV